MAAINDAASPPRRSPQAISAESTGLMLVEEFAHRTANEFAHAIASLRQAARTTSDPLARGQIAQAADRLFAHSHLQKALAMPLTGVCQDIADYMTRLCGALTASLLAGRGAQLRLTCCDATMDSARCWRLALIVSELVHNAARHGLPQGAEIVVELSTLGDQVLCLVRDNGCAVESPGMGRGRRVVTALATELGGHADWRFTQNESRGWVVIPLSGSAAP